MHFAENLEKWEHVYYDCQTNEAEQILTYILTYMLSFYGHSLACQYGVQTASATVQVSFCSAVD